MIYATKTRNASFIELLESFYRRGIDARFILEVKDPMLVDFSIEKYRSFDRKTEEYEMYREAVISECSKNIWFFFREIVKNFVLTEETLQMIYLFSNGISFIADSYTTEMRRTYHLLWYYYRSSHNDDLTLTSTTSLSAMEEFQRHIASMSTETNIGLLLNGWPVSPGHMGTLQINDSQAKALLAGGENIVLREFSRRYTLKVPRNHGDTKSCTFFDLDMSASAILQSLALQVEDESVEWKYYLINIGSDNTDAGIILKSWLKRIIPKFTESDYNSDQLGGIYYL